MSHATAMDPRDTPQSASPMPNRRGRAVRISRVSPPVGWTLPGLVVAGLMLAATGMPARADEARERPLVFGVNRVANPSVLFNPPDYDEHVYQRVRDAGGTVVRLLASPRDVERIRGERDWAHFDRDLKLALKYEQEPIVLICNTPAWASPTGEDTHQYPYKTELFDEFADFCTELARRTRGKVKYFQLWNEQNGCSWHFHDGFNHADEYLPFLKVCYGALKKGNPDCILSMGSLDDAEGHAPIFLRRTYEEMKKQNVSKPIFDAISDHPYSPDSKVMRQKLDALQALLKANGDAGTPLWITEYGWRIGHKKPKEQGERMAEVLAGFIRPEFNDLEIAIYLSIGDFAGEGGFGICDANLRPRPAFHAFQGASRFGAHPPCEIEPVFTAADKLEITFRTIAPTEARVILNGPDSGKARTALSGPGERHRVAFDSLESNTRYRFVIETLSKSGGKAKTARSVEHVIHSPDRNVLNGGFEKGFFAGIARDWRITGTGYCTDAALTPFTRTFTGRHAQLIYADGKLKHPPINSTLSTPIVATPGETVRVALRWVASNGDTQARFKARLGIAPNGGADPSDVKEWSDWQDVTEMWTDQTVSVTAANSLVRLFIQCMSTGSFGDGQAAFILDDVRVLDPR